MGWMHLQPRTVHPAEELAEQLVKTSLDVTVTHVEDTNTQDARNPESYRAVPASFSDDELPFIPASVVSASATSSRHWIVIDNIVYDCTEFINEHPGGQEVLMPFKGHDCSWQFWRFHGKGEMQQAKKLRLGRTSGVKNKFKERPRFVGLRPWGADYL
ncbi:cytochrome b5-like heme/steroid binding domain-containing protein [Coniochaeta sp. 2T2.1]|nr:cytochrome b5-like heme/steroid binding domain-containing protein [Coniochaeta sp. 2T2.1]